jgi:SAM-dependent methyltransferase
LSRLRPVLLCRAIVGDDPTCPVCAAPLGEPALRGPDRLHGTAGSFAVTSCERCGAGRTLPLLADQELGSLYPSEYGPYDNDRMSPPLHAISSTIRRMQARSAWRGQPLSALRRRAPGCGLDVGCGRGDLAVMLAGHGWQMTGIEPSPQACAIAAARGVQTRRGTLLDVELEAGAYDAIVFRHALEHTNDPVEDLRRAARALAAGGLVLISVPNFGCWQAKRFGSHWFHLDLPRHRVHFTATSLRMAIEAAGLRCSTIGTSTSSVGLPGSVQYALLGRCAFPNGLALRVASGLAALTRPLAQILNRLARGGDELHAVACRPPARRTIASSTSSAIASAGPG